MPDSDFVYLAQKPESTLMVTQKARDIKPFIVMEVLEKAAEMERQGIDVVHLEVGEPDFAVPPCVSKAVQQAFEEGRTHYTHSLGDGELRDEIARKYKREYGVDILPDQILVTSGSSPAILLTLGVLCENGDEVIISDPGYACYAGFIRFIDAKTVRVPVYEEDGFQYRPEIIQQKITGRTKAVMINSPMNPTGNLLSLEVMRELSDFNIPIVSDEIYHGLVYGDKAHSILEVTSNAFVLGGFSKLYAMTGLRLGYVIAPREYVRSMQKIQQNLFICASSTAQRAGLEALRSADKDVERMRETYDKRRIYLIHRLKSMGFSIKVEPTGAFYVFVNVKHLTNDSYKLAFDILEKTHVGVTPGIDFGENGEGFIRFSYANSIENIEKGMNRLENYLKEIH